MSTKCPCGLDKSFAECCERMHKGQAAESPEQLMRARFSAFAVKNIDFVAATTDPQALSDFDLDATREWANTSDFFKLEILRSSSEGNKGMVEFKAHYRADGKEHVHHELSKFRKHQGKWFFRDGKLVNPNPPAGDPS